MPDIKSSTLRKILNALLLGLGALVCLALGLSSGGTGF